MKKRKFISFTNEELNTLEKALKSYGASSLLKQVNEEVREREYNMKRYEEWQNSQPKIYCC